MRTGKVELSDFQPGNQGEVRALILAGLGEHWGELDVSLNPDLADIEASYGHGRTVVLRVGGAIVATGTIVPREATTAEIVRMSVTAGRRRTGLGRLILDELLTTARRWGRSAVVLETSAGWHDALAFYRSCGFAVTHHEIGPHGRDAWFRLEV